MPAGIQIFNSAGTVQVDDASPTLAFRVKKTCSIPTPATAGTYFANYGTAYVDFDNCDVPAFAVRPPNGKPVSVWQIERLSATTYRVHLQSGQPFEPDVDWGSSGSGRVQGFDVVVYHFDRPPPPPEHGFGFQAFDATGKITFDSTQKPAIVVASASDLGDPFGSWTLPAGRVGACVMGITFKYLVDNGGDREQFLRNWFTVNNNQHFYDPLLAFYRVPVSSTGPTEKLSGFHSGVLLDVTGY